METPIYRAAYRWTREELDVALRYENDGFHTRAGVIWSVAAALGAFGVVCMMVLWQHGVRELKAYLLCPIPLLLWFIVPLVINVALNTVRAQFKKNPGADQMIEFEISAKEVKHWQRGLYYTAASWKSFTTVAEAPDGFLIYTHTSTVLWLPFRAFETPQAPERVREFIQSNGVPYKKISS